mmetsp:Transcript_2281/g.4703  ORF Transcript_2281/g.4703 Transcript_2281/m.4703 type:complete len:237 (-) Transcript_2281:92-802(-)|eukprot:CAMPEP_0113869776 /NCGR_PEP_ID=MMETSP0780_2-20120614/1721_1 /TAXON_ID=652834 /ORGANISM="Palpitomonas bilix" /LENGTH=236 /DNA_ID=CAMNT_0000854985 /DNA_START=215 /DNA_END=925 /DNA_ORIENTATION=+ /assembly_acc=CAM_ASM_000599
MKGAKTTSKYEWERRIFHAFPALIVVVLHSLEPVRHRMDYLALSLWAATAAFFCIELVRFKSKAVNRLFVAFLRPVLRQREHKDQLTSSFYYFLGVSLSLTLYPVDIAVVSIYCLAFVDPMAGLFGTAFGHLGPKVTSSKSFVGCFAGSVAGCLVCIIHFSVASDTSLGGSLLLFSVLTGLAGAVAEVVSLRLDDNLQLPILSGLIMLFVSTLLGLPLTSQVCNEVDCQWAVRRLL